MTEIVTQPGLPHLGGNMHGGDPSSWCPGLWAELVREFEVETVLDVGCGEGHAVRWFREQGLVVTGIDGLPLNIERAVTQVQEWDLVNGVLWCPVDLVWSCEVAEHIEERYVGNFLQTLANGRVIVMTAAVPGQGGYHHTNCQPSEYWIEKVTILGYFHSWETTNRWREVAEQDVGGDNYFVRTGLVFVR